MINPLGKGDCFDVLHDILLQEQPQTFRKVSRLMQAAHLSVKSLRVLDDAGFQERCLVLMRDHKIESLQSMSGINPKLEDYTRCCLTAIYRDALCALRGQARQQAAARKNRNAQP